MRYNYFLFIFTFLLVSSISAQQIIINEVMFNPGPSSTQDPCQSMLDIDNPNLGREYIELYNPDCTKDIDISGWLIASKTGDIDGGSDCVGGSFCFPPGTVVPAGGFLIIGGADETCNACADAYLSNSIDIKLRDYLPSDYLCICEDGQNYSETWFLPNGQGWIAIYNPDGSTHAAVYWSNYEDNVSSVGNDFGLSPCIPIAYLGTNLKSATGMYYDKDPIIYLGQGNSIEMGKTFSRIPDGGDFQPNVVPSIGPNRVDRCNDGNCISCANLVVTPFQDTCSVGKGKLSLEVSIAISSPSPYHYEITGSNGYFNSFTTSDNPHIVTGLFAGIYSVTITDSQSPPASTAGSATIDDVSDIDIVYTVKSDTCQQGIGSIELQTTGGVQPHVYTWEHTTDNTPNAYNLKEGTYNVTVTGPNGECPLKQSINVPNFGVLSAELSIKHPLCNGDSNGSISVNIKEGEAPFQYVWFDNSTDSSLDNLADGAYTVTVTSADMCQQVLTGVLVEPDVLNVVASNITSVCEGKSDGSAMAIVTGGTASYSYSWESGEKTETASNLSGGVQTIQVIDANACFAIDTFEVDIVPIPNVSFFTESTTGCMPLQITFSNQSDSGSYKWDFGDGATSSATTPTYTYVNSGSYPVSLTVTSLGCDNTLVLTDYITVFPKPKANFKPSSSIASEEESTILFSDQSLGAVSWNWDFNDIKDNHSIEQNPSHAFTSPGEFSVCQIVSNQWGCLDTICKTIQIKPLVALYIPNAFTPDGDGINDYFMPLATNIQADDFEMYVYDKWGNIVFFAENINNAKWDGTYQYGDNINQKVPQGVYVYFIKANFGSHAKKYRGTISIIY